MPLVVSYPFSYCTTRIVFLVGSSWKGLGSRLCMLYLAVAMGLFVAGLDYSDEFAYYVV